MANEEKKISAQLRNEELKSATESMTDSLSANIPEDVLLNSTRAELHMMRQLDAVIRVSELLAARVKITNGRVLDHDEQLRQHDVIVRAGATTRNQMFDLLKNLCRFVGAVAVIVLAGWVMLHFHLKP